MTIVLDNLPPAVSEALEKKAQEQGRTLREVVLDTLQRGLAASDEKRDLTDIAGTWADDPAFDKAVEEFERVDSELWK
jgi:hypothetical protein